MGHPDNVILPALEEQVQRDYALVQRRVAEWGREMERRSPYLLLPARDRRGEARSRAQIEMALVSVGAGGEAGSLALTEGATLRLAAGSAGRVVQLPTRMVTGSAPSLDYVSDYQIKIFSNARWYEEIHQPVSYASFYLPFEALKGEGRERFEALVLAFCRLLKPMHGLAGLGLQQCYESHEYQYLEYTIAHQFSGLDISGGNTDERLHNGFKSVNWLTLLGEALVAKLGGAAALQRRNADPVVTFTPYAGGLVVKAGEAPALGYVQSDPWPRAYVRVNNLLRVARAPEIDSLGFGSIAGEIRFNDRTTAQWLARFDRAEEEEARRLRPSGEPGQRAIMVVSGQLCRFSGLWSGSVAGEPEPVYEELEQGFDAPFWRDADGVEHEVVWTLLRREDGGPVQE
ncbi:type VI immunity family protein [Intestinirhabdus alba]